MDIDRFQEILFADFPAQLDLAAQAVHIWRTPLDLSQERIQQLAETLAADEQIRAKRFRFERDRLRFIAGRGMLRFLLGHYLCVAPAALQFTYSSRGKPALASPAGSSLAFNVSHSQDLALYAVSCDRLVGIDVEYIRDIEDLMQLAQRYFLPGESALIQESPPQQRQHMFFRLWTCKEAYLKATGEGITGLKRVEVVLENSIAHLRLDNVPAVNWTLLPLYCQSDYAAALAVEGRNLHVSYYSLLQ